jgi:hypothetical protein
MVRDIAGGAIFSVARREVARHWRTLVVLGVLAGFVGGPVVGALVLARRTATAYPRLDAAPGPARGPDRRSRVGTLGAVLGVSALSALLATVAGRRSIRGPAGQVLTAE